MKSSNKTPQKTHDPHWNSRNRPPTTTQKKTTKLSSKSKPAHFRFQHSNLISRVSLLVCKAFLGTTMQLLKGTTTTTTSSQSQDQKRPRLSWSCNNDKVRGRTTFWRLAGWHGSLSRTHTHSNSLTDWADWADGYSITIAILWESFKG